MSEATLFSSGRMLRRDVELAALDARLDDVVKGHGGVAVVTGPLGIGKTTLLAAMRDRARARGLTTLVAQGGPLERDYAYGVVRRLFEPMGLEQGAPADRRLLAGAAALAARAFAVGPPEALAAEDGAFATIHGLYWLTVNLAAQSPLVLIVDDAHWADAPSLRFLAYLGARLEGLAALLLVSLRPGIPAAPLDVLTELIEHAGGAQIRPSPLDIAAVAALVRGQLADATDEFCRGCHRATGGNPLLLLTLVRSLGTATAPAERATTAESVAAFGAPDVARVVTRQLAHLPTGAQSVAAALAVLGAHAPLRHVAALADLDLETTADIVEPMRATGILSPGPALDFAHPVLRAAVAEAMTPTERARAHHRAALLLARDGAAPERQAVHLLHTVPRGDPTTVDTLRAAADAAAERGAPDTAAVYLGRALDEPPTPDLRGPVRLALGLALLTSQRDPSAPEILRQAVIGTDPSDRVAVATRAARALGVAGYFDDAAALDWVLPKTAQAAAANEPVRLLEAEVLASAWLVASRVPDAQRRIARYRAATLPDDRAGRLLLVSLAHQMLLDAGPVGPATELLLRALGHGDLLGEHSLVNVVLAMDLSVADEFGLAERLCSAVIRKAQRSGLRSIVATFAFPRSFAALRRGFLAEAEADSRWSFELKLAMGNVDACQWPLGLLLDTLVARGDLAGAEEALARAPLPDPPPETMSWAMVQQARGGLRLAQGRTREAVDDLIDAGGRWHRVGCRTPSLATWRGDAARALALLGDHAEARRLSDEQLALARATGLPRVIGNALRAAAAAAPAKTQLALLDEAVGLLRTGPARLDLAQALVDLGAALRRSGRRVEARAPLRDGLDIAHRAGADPLAQTAQAELVAAGARPRRPAVTGLEALTISERRAAALAAEGLTNREIAERLFVTQRTVETHLQHAFRKLGIHRRDDLPAALQASP